MKTKQPVRLKWVLPALCGFLAALSVHAAPVTLEADGTSDTYTLIESVFGPGTADETPDCAHPEFGPHITQSWDNTLSKYIFNFFIHVSPDDDRCIIFDRQRNEIKTMDGSPTYLVAYQGETTSYRWYFKLDAGFQPSANFTHIHQIKAVNGVDDDMPIITISPYTGSPETLRILYAPPIEFGGSQAAVTSAPLSSFKGEWIEATEKMLNSSNGTYEIVLKKVSDGSVLLSYTNNNIIMWRGGDSSAINRPKWGIYRSLISSNYLRDELLQFADFSLAKGSDTFSNLPPSITTAPTNLTITEGQDAIFTVAASGTAPLQYRWRFNTTNNLAWATNATMIITNARSSSAGSYLAVVSNSAGTVTSAVATLTVNAATAPGITQQPQGVDAMSGMSVDFNVTASGSTPLTYQWRKDGSPITGGTNNPLSFASVSPIDAGDYDVIVANVAGSVTSSVAVLTVVAVSNDVFTAAGITNWVCPADVTSIQVECWGGGGAGGSAKKLGSTSYGGGGAGGVYAKYNSYPVTPGNTYYISVGAGGANNSTNDNTRVSGGDSWFNSVNSPSSTIIAKGGAGGETATGTNSSAVYGLGGIGTTNGSAGDVVYAGGSGFTAVSSKAGGGGSSAGTATNGTTATSNVGAIAPTGGGNGGTGPTTTSTKGGNGYAPGGAGAGARSGSSTLYAGGTGAVGKVIVTYTVASPPIITNQPASQVVNVGDTAMFTVGINGAVPLSYRWRFNATNDLQAADSTLVITNVQLSHAGDYTAVVTNSYGAVTSAVATLTVETPVYLESLLTVDFESDTVGEKPANGAVLSGPTAITATQAIVVVASTPMGTGQGVHYIDNGTAPMRLDYDLPGSVSALRFDFQFSPVTSSGSSTNYIVAGVAQTGITTATQTNRYAEVRIYASGAVRFYVGASASATYQKAITNGEVSSVSMFVNDSLDSITYTGADGSPDNTLDANQVAYWWNNEFVLAGNLSGPVNTTTNGLGRIGFSSSSGNIALDTYIDNIQAWEIMQSSIPSGSAPSVSLTAPANNASFTEPASIAMTATASDTDGTITSVGFYNGATLLGSDTSSPYAYTWTNVAAGSYSLTARATDNDSMVSTSAVIAVTVANATYTLTVNSGSGDGSYTNGRQVAITADAPASGKAFYRWTGDTQYVNNVTYTNATVTMPANAVTLTATYVDVYYALTVNSGSGDGSYTNGAQVAITADAPATGKAFSQWTGDTQVVASASSASTTVTMPANAVTLTATYVDVYYDLTVTGGSGDGSYTNGAQVAITADAPASGMTFDKWTGDTQVVASVSSASTTVTMLAQAAALTATYKNLPGWYTLTVSNGTGSGIYSNGVHVLITAVAPAGTAFSRWTGDTQCVAGVFSLNTIVTMPAQDADLTAACEDSSDGVVNMSWTLSTGTYFNPDITSILGPTGSGKTTIAQLMYSPDAVKDSIQSSGVGAVNDVVLDTAIITENGDGLSEYGLFSASTVRAWTNGYVYALIFQDGNAQPGDWYLSSGPLLALEKIATNASPQSIDINTDTLNGDAINGVYGRQVERIMLTVNSGSGSGSYTNGEQVAITADTISGKVFDQWTGDTQYVASGSSASTTVTMPVQDIALTATYVDATYALTVNSGSGSGSYTNGQQVAISADTPAEGQLFDQWTGDTAYVNNVTYTNALVTMPAQAVALTATYKSAAVYHTLTGSAGADGTVSPTSTNVLAGNSATFVITADNYYRIAALTTNGTAVTGMTFDNNSTTTNFIWSNVQTSGVLTATFTNQVTTSAPADVPYEWLAGYGLTNSGATFDQAADADTDLDGLTAWQEYITGTDPTNTASCFNAAQTTLNKVSWSAVSGRVYSVYWSTNLMNGFTALNTNIPYPQNSYTNATPDPRVNHYQIKVRLQ